MGILDEIDRVVGGLTEGTRHARAVGSVAGVVTHAEVEASREAPPSLGRRVADVTFGHATVEAALFGLSAAATGISALVSVEQRVSALGPRPPPGAGTPALDATGGFALAPPHAHMHPPNLVPPNPVPIPMPSFGQLVPIPFLSGASTVLVGGLPAARCGDMGLAMFCGGYFPMFEVLTGSQSVWIEGMRAGRALDLTKHCLFSSPRPSDPPLGPMMGVIAGGHPTVLVGGAPMPSLTTAVIAGATRLLFAAGRLVTRAATAGAYVEHLLGSGAIRIEGDAAYRAAVVADLQSIARTAAGRDVLGRIETASVRSGRTVTIRALEPLVTHTDAKTGVVTQVLGEHNAFATPETWHAMFDEAGQRGEGSSVTVTHSPSRWGPSAPPSETWRTSGGVVEHTLQPAPAHTTSDMVLHHELTHSASFVEGEGRAQLRPPGSTTVPEGTPEYTPGGPEFAARWKNAEEYVTVMSENAYRREVGLGPWAEQRSSYGALP